MNFKRMAVALAIGLFISGSCTYLLSRTLRAKSVAKVPDTMLVAPAMPIAAGETLKAEDLTMVKWPTTQPIPDSFTKPEMVIGRSLLYPVDQGQPITEKFLTAVGAGPGLAGKIPDGMRAVALRSDEVVGVAGFLLPGTHVDVLATIHTDKDPEPITFTVLQNAEVLAAGQKIQPDPEGKPAPVTVVTLLLSPPEAERAVLAAQQGAIHFILRSGSDKSNTNDSPIELSQLVSGTPHTDNKGRVRYASPAPKPPPVLAVQTISGEKLTTDTFRMGNR